MHAIDEDGEVDGDARAVKGKTLTMSMLVLLLL